MGAYIITVLLKGKLTVTRESQNSTRDSILDPQSSSVTRELALSSFKDIVFRTKN